jgi:hypothetical protein
LSTAEISAVGERPILLNGNPLTEAGSAKSGGTGRLRPGLVEKLRMRVDIVARKQD